MPLIRPDAMPIERDEVAAVRSRLTEPFQCEVVCRDDIRCLFVRSDKPDPDPINDLEAALNAVPDWAILDLSDIILLGDGSTFHVPARAAQPILERRRRIDTAALQALRAGLDPHYGTGLHRVTGDFANTTRLGLRLPRRSVKELDDHDLNRLARALGPALDADELRHVRIAYIVAEEDHLRLRGSDIVADLAPRWQEIKRVPIEPATPAMIAAEPTPVEAPPPVPARARRRPPRTIRVKPALEFETHLDAIGVHEQDQARLDEAEALLDSLLVASGYDVARRVEHDKVPYALAAERTTAYPRRVLVRTRPRVDRADAEEMLRAVRAIDADLLICLTTQASDAAHRRLLATKVKVLDPAEARGFRL